MDRDIKVSFIPKKPLARKEERRRPVGVFLFVSSILLIASIGATGATYYLKKEIEQDIETKRTELSEFKKRFDNTDVIPRAVTLEGKINTIKEILDKHTALTPFFNFLEEVTATEIQFTSFAFSISDAVGGVQSGPSATESAPGQVFTVTMSGVSPSYEVLAYQSDVLADRKDVFDAYSIGDVTLDLEGKVTFVLSANLKEDFLLYKKGFASLETEEGDNLEDAIESDSVEASSPEPEQN